MTLIHDTSRRRFLRSSVGAATAIGIGATVPRCFADAAMAASAGPRILVVVQLSGGNDGLNTVIPHADDAYHAARPKLAIAASDVLRIDDAVGLHPSMGALRERFDDGQVSIIQGVGYDQPNRSHFESMDIWHTCRRKDQSRPDGWIGRFLSQSGTAAGGDVPAMHLGREPQPLAIASRDVPVPTIRDLREFQLRGKNPRALRTLLDGSFATPVAAEMKTAETNPAGMSMPESGATGPASNDLLQFLRSSTQAAMAASARVQEASTDYRPVVAYPDSELGQKMRVIAQLIDAGLNTRIYYVGLDGFDTHSRQAATHANLLRQYSDAVSALVRDLHGHGHGDRVCVMTFSEFGRRVAENASEGTDHGAAGPMFLCGGGLRGGVVGPRVDLEQLREGDLAHTVDFRQVYASVLTDWLGGPPASILGGDYPPLDLFA